MKEIKEQILEWNSYLPEVKRQSIDVLVENIIDLAVAKREKEIVERIEKRMLEEKSAKPADEIERIDERAYLCACKDIINLITTK